MTALAIDGNANAIQCLRPSSTQKVASTGTASNATAIAAGIRVVRIVADAAIHYSLIGTATTSSVYLPSGAVEFVSVKTGDVFSLIGSANVYITLMD